MHRAGDAGFHGRPTRVLAVELERHAARCPVTGTEHEKRIADGVVDDRLVRGWRRPPVPRVHVQPIRGARQRQRRGDLAGTCLEKWVFVASASVAAEGYEPIPDRVDDDAT